MDTIPSRDELLKLVAREVSADKLRDAVVYVYRKLLRPGDTHYLGRINITVSSTSALLFIDLIPMANWSHDCLYILFNGNETSTIPASFPPDRENLLLLQKPDKLESWVLLSEQPY
jgi:hypothetical protein